MCGSDRRVLRHKCKRSGKHWQPLDICEDCMDKLEQAAIDARIKREHKKDE